MLACLIGGATNPLRMGTAEELELARPVTVQLAAGTCDLWLSSTRVLLSAQPGIDNSTIGHHEQGMALQHSVA